jgi:eukaryotic-like serine/threonine-protein kinase
VGIEKGSRLGPYEIVGPLGAGGMGEVYRARDTRLGRDVAIKALPEEFSRDPERLARFEREARLLASLHHANIAGIHGLEVVDGRRYLVLECVEGETLAARLRRGAIPVNETIDIARAVAAALEAAHEAGIVHRDLKPGNVMLTAAGEVKVLDFGLAKGSDSAGSASDPDLSASPTLTYAGTQAGVILGTAAYMSPEQARGKAVDRRTDIWSFGCLVFECLTARQAFAGETVSDILAHILQSEPSWSALPASTPERLRGLLRRCLEKDLKRRQRDIGDARIELEDLQALRESHRVARAADASRGLEGARLWAVAAVAAAVVAAATWFAAAKWSAAPPAHAVRFEVAGPKHREIWPDPMATSLSPDGQWMALIATDSSFTPRIWIRRLDSLTPRELAGTENVTIMFWSPDSRYLAFFSGDHLLSKIAIAGGEPERICEVKAARGGTWNRDGVILLAPYSNGGIYRVSANGGEPVVIIPPDSAHGETGNRFPFFLPDGHHFLYTAVPAGVDGKFGLYVGSMAGDPPRLLERIETGAVYCDPGWLLTTRDNALVAQRFDARTRRLSGEPSMLGDGPNFTQFSGGPPTSVSRTGTLSYLTRTVPTQRLFWMDLAGHETSIPGFANGPYFYTIVSPDGRRALLDGVSDNLKGNVSLVDLERGTVSRLTPTTENAGGAVWSPDGQRIAYLDGSNSTLVVRSLADGSTRSYLASDHSYKRLDEWSRDGRYLLFERLDATTKWDVWLLPVEGDGPPRIAVRSPANEEAGRLSPDGHWVAFTSDESGVAEIYVQAVGSAGLKYQVTTGGGGPWYWARDGKSLVFQRTDRTGVLYRAAVQATEEFSLSPPAPFIRLPEDYTYAFPASDEKRFLVLRPAEKPERQTITVIQNWQAALRKP